MSSPKTTELKQNHNPSRGSKTVNHLWHDEFVALCALFPSGELTEEEWALLQVHLAYCDSCRIAFDQYQRIATEVLPIIVGSATLDPDDKSGSSSFSLGKAQQRLMATLDASPADLISATPRRLTWQTAAVALAVCAIIAVALAGVRLHRTKASPVVKSNAATQVGSLKPIAMPSDESTIRLELEHSQHKAAELQKQLNEAKENWQRLNTNVTRIQEQFDAERTERQRANEERGQLMQQLESAQGASQSLQDKVVIADTAVAQQAARTASLEARLRDANADLEEKDRMLALDKEFLGHDREIRDLIGARDLYIADIYDVAQNGKTNKPFGRVFYTRDKSLVFYGYDLDKQMGLTQSVAFQAWGTGDNKQNVSLGLFYQDETHKRWVLRFNDTKTLARLNAVFVTAEPQGGSVKPTGKPLLRAYLQMQSNHP